MLQLENLAVAGLNSRKLVNNKWLYTEKKQITVYTQLYVTGRKKQLHTDCDPAFFLYICIFKCNGDVLSKNNVRLIQLDKMNTYVTTLLKIAIREFNKTVHL
jgi:hypothetical protein